MRKYRDENWLREQYGEKGRSQRDIGEECGVGSNTICYWVNKYEIEKKTKKELARENPLSWSKDIAYLTGLITSDGSLVKNRPMIKFPSKDKNLVKQVKEIVENKLGIGNCKIRKVSDGTWRYSFTSRRFYYFLEDVGLMPNKSLKLGELNIPEDMFYDWLRGEIDGDGSFLMSQGYLRFKVFSGSKDFLEWVSNYLKKLNLVNGVGNVSDKGSCYRLVYSHNDTQRIAKKIYDGADYYLRRKYNVVEEYI